MKKLPVDISTFAELRNNDYVYVDKTEHMHTIITQGRRYFLSRPRRFGKSLLISTLKEILTAQNRNLFDGLWIAQSDYSWKEYGVIQLDFSLLYSATVDGFKKDLCGELYRIAKDYQIILEDNSNTPHTLLKKLVHSLFEQFGRVAILVDEYDSQILKSLHNKSLAQEIRDEIQHFFTTIKGLDAHIQFVFITGVSSFAKAGLFSGINNVQIITLRDKYASLCGYTESEVDDYFTDYITHWAQKKHTSYDSLREQIRSWYNGYSFGSNVPKVYNPFSLMNALEVNNFENFWFQSGAPTFLIEILKKDYKNIEQNPFEASKDTLGIFDVGIIPVVSLMFQTGYLTITGYNEAADLYTLNYPNLEVKKSFQKYLLEIFAHIEPSLANDLSGQLSNALNNENIEKAVNILKQLFAHVPYQLHIKEESFYHSLLIMVCTSAGIKVHAEHSTSHGRIDLVLEFPKIIYVIEVKFNDTPEHALQQIEDRRYYERFLSYNKSLILLGLAFTKKPQQFDISYIVKNINPG